MHHKNLLFRGKKLEDAEKVLVMIHGRGASAESILALASHLNVNDYALVAPQATNNSWYPLSFLADPNKNEPWLTFSIDFINDIVKDLLGKGKLKENIYFLGFSQGACLALEYTTRNAAKWGGIVAFTGGLIGDKIYKENYQGDFAQTPVFIGTSDPDSHVPVERVNESVVVMESMSAKVALKVYPNMGHTINQEEIELVNKLILK